MNVDPRTLGASCDLCPLAGKTPVFGVNAVSGATRLVIVGEGPGRRQEAQGILHGGAPSALLNEALEDAGLDRNNCHFTLAHLCRAEGEKEATAAAKCCAPRLLREVAAIEGSPPILALGKEATRGLLGVSNITLARGFVWTAPDVNVSRRAKNPTPQSDLKAATLAGRKSIAGRTVFPTIHPSFVLRSEAWRSVFRIDVRRAGKLLEANEFTLDSYHPRAQTPSYTLGWWAGDDPTAIGQALSCLEGNVIACDIETTIQPSVLGCDIVCAGVGDGVRTVVIDPWVPKVHAPLLTTFFRGKTVVGHNFINFDMVALSRDGVEFDHVPEDTLLAHHAFASHFPQKLDQVISEFCDSVPWKIVFGRRGANIAGEKGGLPPADMEPEERDKYCALDVKLTALAWSRMQKDLAPERSVYETDKQLAMLCQGMQVTGIGVDEEGRVALSKLLKRRKAALKGKMRTLLKWPLFSPRKPGDVRRAIYTKLQAPVLQRSEKTGQPGTSEAVLEGFIGAQGDLGEFARLLMTYRLVDKVDGTYVMPTKQAMPIIDGRAHYSWKAHGTVAGRLAGRLQSCPRYGGPKGLPESRPRTLYLATGKLARPSLVAQIHDAAIFEVGDTLVYFDLAQAEARLAAYLSGDTELIAAVEYDIHTENAKLLFGTMPGAGDRLARANEKSPSGVKWKSLPRNEGGCKEERDVTKNAGFCVWYVGEAKAVYENLNNKGFPVPMRVCQIFYDRCHDKYWRYYRYVHANLDMVRKQGFMRTALSGRYRHLGYFAPITDVANFPIQAGIADIMNSRLVVLEREVQELTTVEEVVTAIKRTWAAPVILPKGPIVSEERSFVLPADIKTGRRWSDL